MTPDDSTGPSVGPDGNCTGPIRSKSKLGTRKNTNKYHRFQLINARSNTIH